MEQAESTDEDQGRVKLMNPVAWILSACLIWAIIIVPLTMAFFYMLKISPKLFSLPNQYSAVFGLILGLIISFVVGYFYSNRARKNVE